MAPLLYAMGLSFYDWDGLSPKRFIGLANYREAFADPTIRATFLHVVELFAFYTFFPDRLRAAADSPSDPVADPRPDLLSHRPVPARNDRRRGRRPGLDLDLRTSDGPLNAALRAVGLGSFAQAWLGSFTWALPAVGLVGTWVSYGLCMVLFIAGAQRISPSLYEAARVDGAGAVREFFAVTLPGLRVRSRLR